MYTVCHLLVGPGGGAWTVVKRLAEAQSACGGVAICLSHQTDNERQVEAVEEARRLSLPVLVHAYPRGRFMSALMLPPIQRWCAELQESAGGDVVLHVHNAVLAGLMPLQYGKRRLPIVSTFHGIVALDDPDYQRNKHIQTYIHGVLVRRAVRRGAHYVAVSEATAAQVRTVYRIPEDARVEVVFNGTGECVEWKSRERTSVTRLAFVGELGDRKNVVAACEAVLRCAASGSNVRLVICGDGPLRGTIETLAALHPNVLEYRGIVADARSKVIAQCDALLLPSHSEGLPMVIVEAASVGVPAIATAVGGVAEIVSDGVNGILLAGTSKDAIVDGVSRFLGSDRLLLSMACRETYREKLTVEKMVAGYDEIYRRALTL